MMQRYERNSLSCPIKRRLLSKLLGSIQSPITNLARVTQSDRRAGGADAEAAPAAEEAAEEAPAAAE